MILIRRGTTPTITIKLPSELSLSTIVTIWVYIYQQDELKVDRLTDSIDIIDDNTMGVTLTQEETLSLEPGYANIQVRLLDESDKALASTATSVRVVNVYKEGIIGAAQGEEVDTNNE